MTEKMTFRSEVNGLQFDSVNGTTNHLLSSHKKSQFVKPESPKKGGKGGKPKVTVGVDDDNEQEIG